MVVAMVAVVVVVVVVGTILECVPRFSVSPLHYHHHVAYISHTHTQISTLCFTVFCFLLTQTYEAINTQVNSLSDNTCRRKQMGYNDSAAQGAGTQVCLHLTNIFPYQTRFYIANLRIKHVLNVYLNVH